MTMNNLEKYKKDLEELIKAGENLYYAMIVEELINGVDKVTKTLF